MVTDDNNRRPQAAGDLYRAIWRWHFYAGLAVAPFLLILSITGAIYLFNDEIEDRLNPGLRFVTTQAPAMPVSHWIAAAQMAHPGTVTRVDMPASPDRPGIVSITPATGAPLQVAVEPGTMRVMGASVYERTLTGFARVLHGTLTIGKWGDHIVELVACWTLVLLATGLYLWWPRGARANLGGVFFPRLWLRGRLLWRDLHITVGVWTAVLILFMILTGLPWAEIQGRIVRQGVTALGIGYPVNRTAPQSVPLKSVLRDAPWTLEETPLPQSEHHDHSGAGSTASGRDTAAEAGVDGIVAGLKRQGLTGGYALLLPTGPKGVYTASVYPNQPQGQRTLFFDRYSGALMRETGYRDYGWGAKAIELGVQLHMGNYFGRINQIVMLLPCIGIILLVVTGIGMWWKRRPSGKLAPPPKVPEARLKGAMILMGVAGVLLPLFGASLIAVVIFDRAAMALRPSR